jgi:uncharacterized protein YcfJ
MRPISMPATRWLWLLLAIVAFPAAAQETVVPKRNVRTGVAQVLRVDPVYQTLTATAMQRQCAHAIVAAEDPPHGLSRIVGAVKEALTPDRKEAGTAPAADDADCQMVPVERRFRRPIAYDVDYIYKGMKYRSRLPYDPGNRLRVQVTVQPFVPPAGQQE